MLQEEAGGYAWYIESVDTNKSPGWAKRVQGWRVIQENPENWAGGKGGETDLVANLASRAKEI